MDAFLVTMLYNICVHWTTIYKKEHTDDVKTT